MLLFFIVAKSHLLLIFLAKRERATRLVRAASPTGEEKLTVRVASLREGNAQYFHAPIRRKYAKQPFPHQ